MKSILLKVGLVALVGMALIWQHVQATLLGYKIEKLREEMRTQKALNAYLKADLAGRLSPSQFLAEAERRLQMKEPEPGSIIYLEGPAAKPVLSDGSLWSRISLPFQRLTWKARSGA